MSDTRDQDDELAALTRRLFAQAPSIDLSAFDPPPAREGNNHVPTEGTGNERRKPADYDARDAAGELFGVHPNARNLHNDDPDNIPPRTTEHHFL